MPEFNADGRRIVLAARKQDNSPGGAWLWNLDTSSTPELARDVSVSRAVFSLPASGTEEFVATAEGEVGAVVEPCGFGRSRPRPPARKRRAITVPRVRRPM